MVILWVAILMSVVGIGLSVYALFGGSDEDTLVVTKEFVDELNQQMEEIQASKKDIEEVRGEYKKGFELSIDEHESLSNHMNENFSRTFGSIEALKTDCLNTETRLKNFKIKKSSVESKSLNNCMLEIQAIWAKLESLGVKKNKKRGRPRKKDKNG